LRRPAGSVTTEEVVDLLQSWKWGAHYGVAEWEDVGAVICRALLAYTNLGPEVQRRKAQAAFY
ncbi:unnamed protein product, partial [Heterosigma akashiwo]